MYFLFGPRHYLLSVHLNAAYQHALDQAFLRIHNDIRHGFVFGVKHDLPSLVVYALQGAFSIDQGGYDLPILSGVLLLQDNEIIFPYAYVDHTVTVGTKDEQISVTEQC